MKRLNQLLGKINHVLFAAVSNQKAEEVYAQTRQIGEEMSRAYSLYENTELEGKIKQYRQFTQAFRDSLEPAELVMFYMGMLAGYTECFGGLFTERNQSDKLRVNPAKSQYYNKIIQILSQKEYVQHKDLAAALGIKVSSLTRIMKTIEEDDQTYIIVSSVGKYKYYCLTDAGKKYYAQYINQERWRRPEEAIEEMLAVIKKRIDTDRENLLIGYVSKCYPYDYHIAKKMQALENSIRRNVKPAAEREFFIHCFEKNTAKKQDWQTVCNSSITVVYQAIEEGMNKDTDSYRIFSKGNVMEMAI